MHQRCERLVLDLCASGEVGSGLVLPSKKIEDKSMSINIKTTNGECTF